MFTQCCHYSYAPVYSSNLMYVYSSLLNFASLLFCKLCSTCENNRLKDVAIFTLYLLYLLPAMTPIVQRIVDLQQTLFVLEIYFYQIK